MIDWHCHLLPGLDDGPVTIDESVEMARLLANAGFTRICCTPHHITGSYENPASRVHAAVDRLQSLLDSASIPLVLVPGTEYYLDEFFLSSLSDPLTINGNMVLVEAPNRCDRDFLMKALHKIVGKGLVPVIAHPERCDVFSADRRPPVNFGLLRSLLRIPAATPDADSLPSDMQILKENGCRFQGNICSFAGLYGKGVQAAADRNVQSGAYDCFGTDGHSLAQLERWLDKGMGLLLSQTPAEEILRPSRLQFGSPITS
jgi:protein-tyrosine phosphatase